MRTPSVKTLQTIFGDKAKQAKALLTMSRYQLIDTPVGQARFNEWYHAPTTADLRMECLNALGEFHGVEGFDTRKGLCMYLNAGDTYTPTLIYFTGTYRVACWGDIAERHCNLFGETA
jgi:hypothetical protein